MKTASLPPTEKLRIETLRAYDILDTAPEIAFDEIVKFASDICKTPIALISLVDSDRQWFKAKVGIDAPETPRELAFCAHAILDPVNLLIVEDTFKDERFKDNPLVKGSTNIRFYAGCPLQMHSGETIGTLCVIDRTPRKLSPEQEEALRVLAKQVVIQLELRYALKISQENARQREELMDRLAESKLQIETISQFKLLANSLPQLVWRADETGWIHWYNDRWYEYTGTVPEDMEGWGWQSVHDPERLPWVMEKWQKSIATGEPFEMVFPLKSAEGLFRPFLTRATPVKDASGKVTEWMGTNTDIADQKTKEDKAVEALSLSETRNQQLLDGVKDYAIYWLDVEGYVESWNSGAEHIKQYTSKEIIGQSFSIFYTEEDRKKGLPQTVLEIARVNGKFEGEGWRVRKDGSAFWASVDVSAIHDNQGKVISFAKVTRNITERKKSEEERQKLIAIIEESVDYIGMADINGKLDYHNLSATRMIGLPDNYNLSQLKIPDMHPEWARKIIVEQAIPATHATGSWQGETALLHKDGYEIPVLQNLSLHRNDKGEPICFTTIMRDITERKKSETALKISEERFQLAAKGMSVGVWDWNILTGEMYWSQKLCDIFGIKDPHFIPNLQSFAALLYPDDRERVLSVLSDHLEHKVAYDIEYRLKSLGERHIWIHASGQAIWDKQGKPLRMAGSVVDITERKYAEEKIVAYSHELTIANQELEEFAFVASHDLKAPLRVIDNASKWLEEDLEEHLTPDTRESMALLRGRVKRMDKLLDDLLNYSCIGKKSEVGNGKIISGDDLIENILELLSPPAEFFIKISPTFANIKVFRMPLQQILLNLISNAIKHHDKKTGTIEVSVTEQDLFYHFQVTDDGPGIPLQFHEKVFKMFQTLKPRDQVEGSGMGLALVKKNIRTFGGKLTLDSAEGKGSNFCFTWSKNQAIRSNYDDQ